MRLRSSVRLDRRPSSATTVMPSRYARICTSFNSSSLNNKTKQKSVCFYSHSQTNGGLMMNGSSAVGKDMAGHQMWNNVGHTQPQMPPPAIPQHHHRSNNIADEENQSLRSDHSNSMAGLSSNRVQSTRSSRHQPNRPLASSQSNKSNNSGHHRSHRSIFVVVVVVVVSHKYPTLRPGVCAFSALAWLSS